jgi:signal transduction histidine kinase
MDRTNVTSMEPPDDGSAQIERIKGLEEAVRMRDELLAVTAHELRNPMHALSLQVAAALSSARRMGDAEVIQRLERTRTLMERFIKRASLLLEVSRMRAGQDSLTLEPVNLQELAREIADSYMPEALFNRVAEIEVTGTGDSEGHWDRLGVEQVLSNLISNAIKYGAGSPVRVAVAPSHDGVWLHVSDQGIGIAPEHQPRIFEQFEQVLTGERRREGFGLGLWLVRRIVHAHKGHIALTSKLGEGSTFSVWLPREPTLAGQT